MTTTDSQTDLDGLTADLIAYLAQAPVDPLMKPFAAILAMLRVSQMASERSEAMRLKIANALIVAMRSVAPEFVMNLPPRTDQGH